ncbi:MAG: type II toxin-antitoxin system RelB/DinJ family antitoxin [Ruminococcus sp.]|nr:type II toxin-antitoxin system RelB/DinJ family antitoxin [Ruminococcus sp.]
MPNTTAVNAVIDTGLKENAEKILARLGLTPSAAIGLFYSRIVSENDIPFKQPPEDLPAPGFLFEGSMTREELDRELQKGIDSVKAGNYYTLEEFNAMTEEIDARLVKEFNL